MKNNMTAGVFLFGIVGVISVVAGGLLSAFSASNPTEFIAWASAYLVLVMGVLQVGLALSVYYGVKLAALRTTIISFVLYNLGNLCVIIGTYIKDNHSSGLLIVCAGGLLLALSMMLVLYLAHHSEHSYASVMLYVIAGVVLVSMPIGLLLAHR